MRRAALLALALAAALAFVAAAPAGAAEIDASLVVAPELDTPNRASPYYVAPAAAPAWVSRQDIEIRLRAGGVNAQGTVRWQAPPGREPVRHGSVRQLYYDFELGAGRGWTVGKKVVSWGVGFGFRPLDVVGRENRRGVNPPPPTGVPLAAIETFSADSAWTLVWTRPGAGAGTDDARDAALALRWYRLAGDDDVHAVARVSHRRGVEAGAGVTRVAGDAWSFHAAALYARRVRTTLNALAGRGAALAAADPMTENVRGGGLKAVAGAQWTGESGWSALVEAWHDADAYRRDDWRRLDALTARQQALAGRAPDSAIAGNAAWSSQAYLAPNLLRDNLLVRVSYDDRDGFKPYAEWLATPADGGRTVTLGASREGNRQRVTAGLRQFGGAPGSAYARAPTKRIVWLEWRLAAF